MKQLTAISIRQIDPAKLGPEVCFDDEGEYEQTNKTLVIKSARWKVSEPNRLVGTVFTVTARVVGSGDVITSDMKFEQSTNEGTRCRFVGVA